MRFVAQQSSLCSLFRVSLSFAADSILRSMQDSLSELSVELIPVGGSFVIFKYNVTDVISLSIASREINYFTAAPCRVSC